MDEWESYLKPGFLVGVNLVEPIGEVAQALITKMHKEYATAILKSLDKARTLSDDMAYLYVKGMKLSAGSAVIGDLVKPAPGVQEVVTGDISNWSAIDPHPDVIAKVTGDLAKWQTSMAKADEAMKALTTEAIAAGLTKVPKPALPKPALPKPAHKKSTPFSTSMAMPSGGKQALIDAGLWPEDESLSWSPQMLPAKPPINWTAFCRLLEIVGSIDIRPPMVTVHEKPNSTMYTYMRIEQEVRVPHSLLATLSVGWGSAAVHEAILRMVVPGWNR